MGSKEKQFHRTMIKSLRVEGYRSLKKIELKDLTKLVIIHGANGTGKSNIIRAIQHILHWAVESDVLPFQRKDARKILQSNLPLEFKLGEDDFSRGQLPELRISIDIQVGSFAEGILGKGLELPQTLSLEAVAQNEGKDILYWFEKASFGSFSLLTMGSTKEDGTFQLSENIDSIKEIRSKRQSIKSSKSEIWRYEQNLPTNIALGRREYDQTHSLKKSIQAAEKEIKELEQQISKQAFLSMRIKDLLLPKLLQHFPAYRTTFKKETDSERNHPITARTVRDFELQSNFLTSWISQDQARRNSIKQLGKRLRQAGYEVEDVVPIWNNKLSQAQLLIDTPEFGELPMSQVGTGMQQLIFLLGGIFANPSALVVIEEPESHLHKNAMLTFAKYLSNSVLEDEGEAPDIDQLWLETHHHAFALAPHYLDVSKDEDGWTQVQMQPRSKAVQHFYEPGPFWEALRQLVDDALDDDDVIFRDASGQPVTVKEIQTSIEGDRKQANEYINALTEMTVAMMRKKAKKG